MLDVKRTSERWMVVRVNVGRSVHRSMVEKEERLAMLAIVGRCGVGDRFWLEVVDLWEL